MRRAVITAVVLSIMPATSFARTWSVQTDAGDKTRSLQREAVWSRKQSSPTVGRLMVGANQRASYLWYLRNGKPGDRIALPKTAIEQRRLMKTLTAVQKQIRTINRQWGSNPLDATHQAMLVRLTDLEKRLLYVFRQLNSERDKLVKRLRGKKGTLDGNRKEKRELVEIARRQSAPKTDADLRNELRGLRRLEGRRLAVFTYPVANPLRALWSTSALALAPRDLPRIPGQSRRWVVAPAF
jgi:hypothetical protein